MFDFILGALMAWLLAGGLGYTADSKIRSEKSFAVDLDLYKCSKLNEK